MDNWSESSMTPPTEGILHLDEPQTSWPKVIGIIGIVLASLGLLCSCPGFFSVPLQRWGASMQSQAGRANPVAEAQLHGAEQYQVVTIVLIAIGMVLSAFLLYGSISLLRRARKSRSILMGWAMASLFVMMVNTALQILVFQATRDHLIQAGEGGRIGEVWMSAAIGGCFGIVFGFALQIFVLVWFSRKKIIAEVGQWR